MAFDTKKFTPFDWGVAATGLLMFIDSFLPWLSASGHDGAFGSYSGSLSGWHYIGAWFPMLLLLAAAAFYVLGAAGVALPALPVSRIVASAAVSAVALLIVIIRIFSLPSGSFGSFSYGPGWGAYLGLVVALAQTGLLVYLFIKSGEKLPWAAGATSTGSAPTQAAPYAAPAPAAPYTPPAPSAEPMAPPGPPGPPPVA